MTISPTQTGHSLSPKNPYAGNRIIRSRPIRPDFVPDGNLGKPFWREAEAVYLDQSPVGSCTHPDVITRVASVWTPDSVYFGFWCSYVSFNCFEGESTSHKRWELWNRDVVEVFINPEPVRFHHYYEFEVAPNNQWIDLEIDLQKDPFHDAGWNSGFEHATALDQFRRVWTCEMRLPVSALGERKIHAGTEWRLNFYRADGPGDDHQRRFMCWSPLPEPIPTFHQPASFGIIRFTGPSH
jgi:hypothetical protein